MTFSEEIPAELMDAGRRASDIVNTYRVHRTWDELKHKWLVLNLSDGSTDGNLYDTRRDAVRHQKHENQVAYLAFRSLLSGTNPKDMAIYLKFCRTAYESGMRLTDPDDRFGGKQLIPTAHGRDLLTGTRRQQ